MQVLAAYDLLLLLVFLKNLFELFLDLRELLQNLILILNLRFQSLNFPILIFISALTLLKTFLAFVRVFEQGAVYEFGLLLIQLQSAGNQVRVFLSQI